VKRPLATLPARIIVSGIAFSVFPLFAAAQTQSFSDVPPEHPVYEAAEFLKQNGIISGYEDGTFKPDKSVNRAEALKIITAPLVSTEQLAQMTSSVYSDVPAGSWYLPYVEWARQSLKIVDGPPSKTAFNGESPVLKVEFIKMLLLANKIEPQNSYSEIRLPLASDASNVDEWYYPYMRFAIASSITMIGSDGNLYPGRELTRGDTALFLYRYLMYQQGRRTQALLSEAETEIIVVLEALEQNEIEQAEYASARALLAARGALASKPDVAIVKGAVKISESFRSLVRAYRAGLNQNYEEVVRLAGEAWNLSARATEFSPDLASISEQVQKISKGMADSARELMGQSAQ